jgi:hypothetical protein
MFVHLYGRSEAYGARRRRVLAGRPEGGSDLQPSGDLGCP